MARTPLVFSFCLYSEDYFDRVSIPIFESGNILLELIVREDLWSLLMFFVCMKYISLYSV